MCRFLILIISGFLLTSYKPPSTGIKVDVTNLRSNNGFVLVSLFKDGAGFPDNSDKAFRRIKLGINDRKATVVFTDVPPGQYAIAILHDENNDQKMNKNSLGLPKEGYGFSNNVIGAFGPPSFRRASFNYSGTLKAIIIKTRY